MTDRGEAASTDANTAVRADGPGDAGLAPERAALVDAALAIRAARGGQPSADGTRVVFVADLAGHPQAWATPADGGWPWRLHGGDRVQQVLAHPDRPADAVAAVDVGGDERAQVHRVTFDGAAPQPLTDHADAVHQPGAFSVDGTTVWTAATRRNGVDFDLWRVPLDGGAPELVVELDGYHQVVDALPDGRVVLVRARSLMDTDVVLVDPDAGAVTDVLTADAPARHLSGGHLPDGRLLLRSDRDGDVLRAGVWDGAWRPVTSRELDCDGLAVRDGLAALTLNDGGRSRLRLAPADALDDAVDIPLPFGVAEDLAVSPGGSGCWFTFSGPRHNANVWHAAPDRRPSPVTDAPSPVLPLDSQPEPVLHHVAAHDGETIPLWLTRPAGVDRPPVVLWLHGGPESQARPGFDARTTLLVAAGYAVAQPNVRGSTGYGRRFAALDDRAGRHDAIADAVTVGRWLADRDDLDGDRVAVGGGSYGGYLTLCALTAAPQVWAAGIDVVGIADLETFLTNTSGYRRAVREAEYGSLAHDRALLRELSPLHRVEAIAAPLLVVHGRNDPRVPVGEAEQIVAALRERDRPVELLVFDDEGHGVVRDANRRVLLRRMLAFLDRHLGAPSG